MTAVHAGLVAISSAPIPDDTRLMPTMKPTWYTRIPKSPSPTTRQRPMANVAHGATPRRRASRAWSAPRTASDTTNLSRLTVYGGATSSGTLMTAKLTPHTRTTDSRPISEA